MNNERATLNDDMSESQQIKFSFYNNDILVSSCDDGGWMSSAGVCVLSVPGPVPDGVLSAVGDQAGRPDV